MQPVFDTPAFLVGIPLAALGLVVLLTITWLIGRSQRRHQVIDAAWGMGFVVVAVISYVASAGYGHAERRLLLLVLTALWGVRLAAYLAWRMRDGHEDPRYEAMLGVVPAEKRDAYAIKRVYLPQAIVLLIVSFVQQVGMFTLAPLTWLSWVGVAVWLIGMFFEVVGDAQLAAFKAGPSKRGTILDTGVWAWTRHPNYFGDTAVWWGLWLITASAWPGVLTLLFPVLMTWALAFRTGKPLTESRMKDRPGFADYVARTSGFIPLPPKSRAGR